MRTIEIARRMAELNQKEEAQKAYKLALYESEGKAPDEELEAASYIFFSEGDYQIAFTTFVSLYNRGCFQAELMDLLTQAFYLPNVEDQKIQYQDNCILLSQYPYLFHKEFPQFEDLPIQFFPFNDQGFIPFYKPENRFGSYVNFNDPVIDRYFFKDLEKPILAAEIYSQYQLEYLNDTVRKSEWVGRENHIYLHYPDWLTFCAYLQCLDFKELLKEKKLVFLIGDEIAQYPIDFKERFGIDYNQYPVKPIGIREVNRMIWHTQLATHNGGDLFNEIFYGHPNLLILDSIMFDSIRDIISGLRTLEKKNIGLMDKLELTWLSPQVRWRLAQIKNPTEKDYLVAAFLSNPDCSQNLDPNSRIVPALFFQPHFGNMLFNLTLYDEGKSCSLWSEQYDSIRNSPIFHEFKYIKTFTPLRRVTTSYGGSMRFAIHMWEKDEEKKVISDILVQRLLNRSMMIDRWDRLYHDSILVRFEDGKLNPKATFSALAEFLDIPYTESMTYCSNSQGKEMLGYETNVRGFDPATVYRTYDEYVDDADRALLEYFFRDVYELYGYDFQYYHGEPVDEAWVEQKISEIHTIDTTIKQTFEEVIRSKMEKTDVQSTENDENDENELLTRADRYLMDVRKQRLKVAKLLLKGLSFVNKEGQFLTMMKPLQLDPALLEQPLYH